MNYAKAVRGTMQEMFGGMEHWADSHAPLGNGPRRQEELQGSIAVDAYMRPSAVTFSRGMSSKTGSMQRPKSWRREKN
jgi:hypothetical protein